MCGIAGVLYADRQRRAAPEVLQAMSNAIAHRGPDGTGQLDEPGVSLVHRRLAIIDLAGGDQPIFNEDRTIGVVFNGEIYNYSELRAELEAKGHSFRTNSDTETLVHLYEEYGAELATHLRGMFAFAIWDQPRRRLLLCRDRVGQKPLFIYRDSEKLVFGSEIKAILAHPDVDRTVDAAAVEEYFTFGVVPGSSAIFKRIEKLPAAHHVVATHENLTAAPSRYWSLRFRPETGRSVADWTDEVSAAIEESVQAHRVADVPIGAFLSGGLDSSAIVATLAGLSDTPVNTFSIGFEERRFSELPHARRVADHFGTHHREEIVTAEAARSLDDLVHFYDEPFADASAIPTMSVARVAAEHVKVVLSGDGGDEAFGGYARYAHDLKEAAIREALPNWFRTAVLSRIAALWPQADWLPRPLRWKSALTNLSLAGPAAYANTISTVRPALRQRLLRNRCDDSDPERGVREAYRQNSVDPLSGMLAADIDMLLPDDFLTKVDRASMAFGLEVRPPLLDHRLLELTARIPASFKIRDGRTKWLLKEIFEPRLPKKLAHREKQGFEIPVDDWLRGELADQVHEAVLSPQHAIADYIDQQCAARLFRQHCRGTGRYGQVLWTLLVFGRWLEKYTTPTVPDKASQKVVLTA